MIEVTALRLDHPRSGAALLEDASLACAAGEVVVLAIEPGAGGSLLLAALLGEVRLGGGGVRLLGHNPHTLRRGALRRLRRRIGVVPQAPLLAHGRDVVGQVALALEIDGASAAAATLAAVTALERVGLLAERARDPNELDGGGRQRLMLARALARGPAVLFADEPTAAQDAAGVTLVAAAIADAAARGAACLLISRDPRLDAEACQRGWRRRRLDGATLVSLAEASAPAIDAAELVIDAHTAPVWRRPAVVDGADAAIPNVLPFPISARAARAG